MALKKWRGQTAHIHITWKIFLAASAAREPHFKWATIYFVKKIFLSTPHGCATISTQMIWAKNIGLQGLRYRGAMGAIAPLDF